MKLRFCNNYDVHQIFLMCHACLCIETRCAEGQENSIVSLSCPYGSVISEVTFASYGTPSGNCGSYEVSQACNVENTKEIVRDLCLGENSCSIAVTESVFGITPCPVLSKTLRVQVQCGGEFLCYHSKLLTDQYEYTYQETCLPRILTNRCIDLSI